MVDGEQLTMRASTAADKRDDVPPRPRRRGRPTKLTAERHRLIAALLGKGATRSDICQRAGIHPATLRRWLASSAPAHRRLRDAVTRAKRDAWRAQREAWRGPSASWPGSYATARLEQKLAALRSKTG